jgi:hypothetical protein
MPALLDLENELVFSKNDKDDKDDSAARYRWSHCSNHEYWANGCPNCSIIHLLSEDSDDPNYFTKFTDNIHILQINSGEPSPKFQLIRQQLARVLAVFFAKAKRKAANAALNKTREFVKFGKTEQLTEEQKKEIILAAYLAIQWNELVAGVMTDLLAAAQSGGADGLMQFDDTSEQSLTEVNAMATEYARKRAAEMIGKRYEGDDLVTDREAKFVIADTTSDDLHDIIEQALENEESLTQLQDRILTAGTFSDLRSQFIAKTEVQMAQVYGHLGAWKNTGKVVAVNVVLSDLHDVYDQCDEIVAGNPYSIDSVPSIPSHPNCRCLLQVVEQ